MNRKKKHNGAIVIADSQFLITATLKSMLEVFGSKVYTVPCKNDLYAFLQKHEAALVITDQTLFGVEATDELTGLKKQYPETALLILTSRIRKQTVSELNHAGIRNIAMKTDDRDEILDAVKAALRGEPFYSREVLDLLMIKDGRSIGSLLLTPSEIDIINMITGGLSTAEMASRKNVGVKTVMAHRKNIFRKLRLSSRSELMNYALKSGLVDAIEYYI
ncbi:MAG: response regulator transcription factor [Chlorobiaceae bacterium]|nr:response regulator transcription factor [Chlorobiaceae bacterium]